VGGMMPKEQWRSKDLIWRRVGEKNDKKTFELS
jgi:hypothetical protein